MAGTDILVMIMGIIATGLGVACFFSEHFHSGKETVIKEQPEKGDGK